MIKLAQLQELYKWFTADKIEDTFHQLFENQSIKEFLLININLLRKAKDANLIEAVKKLLATSFPTKEALHKFLPQILENRDSAD
jgi:hypothetical protein